MEIETSKTKILTETFDGREYKVGYKVVTESLRSLGLRKNPNIVQFPIKEWYFLSDNQIKEGSDDFGGIWVARTLPNAKKLREYMLQHYNQDTKIFKTLLGTVLFFNSYRLKTDGVYLMEEIRFKK